MQFKVPQDVQREDKIIGPLTLKQMIILGIGGGITYAIYIGLAATYYAEIWLPPTIIAGGITLAFAFLRISNMPFHLYLMNYLEYKLLPNKRIWVQGTGYPFYMPQRATRPSKKTEKVEKKNEKSLETLTSILDSHGESEINQEGKKEGLNKIINSNYKK